MRDQPPILVERALGSLRPINPHSAAAINALTQGKAVENRFWSKVAIGTDKECWLWQAGKARTGYGVFRYKGECRLSHQLALEFSNIKRPSPPNHYALHSINCVSRACCNPSHLRWGSAKDNTQDAILGGTYFKMQSMPGIKHPLSKLTEENVVWIRSSSLGDTEIAKALNVSRRLIRRVRDRVCWKHVL